MENYSHGPLTLRHTFLHERGIFRFNLLSGPLIFLALTGLAIWLLPFGVSIQMSVLIHTLLGLAIVIPLSLWQLSHWLATRKTRRSFRKFCAYTGFWTMAVVTVSGLILTWQALFRLNTNSLWDQVQLWVGIAALPFLGYHAWPHEREAEQAPKNGLNGNGSNGELPAPDFRLARRHMWLTSGLTMLSLLAMTGVLAVVYKVYVPDFKDYRLPRNPMCLKQIRNLISHG